MKIIPLAQKDSEQRIMRSDRQMLATGFASPAQSFVEERLTIHQLLVKNETATFFFRIKSKHYKSELFRQGNILVVDRSHQPVKSCFIVAVVNNQFLIVKLLGKPNEWQAIHGKTKELITEEFECWGVIISVIHQLI